MKRRAPGFQVMAQMVWMLSLQNPKLGACKFPPVLVGMGGSASGEVWGWAGTWHLVELGYDGNTVSRAAAKTGVAVFWGDLPCPGCHILPGPAARLCPAATTTTEGGWDSTSSLGRFFSLTALICSLCSFGLWYQGSSKDPRTSSCSGTWEIIDSLDTQLEPEGESKAGSSSPDRAMAPL